LTCPAASKAPAIYTRLKAEITEAGLFEPSPFFYIPLIVLAFSAYLISAWAIIVWTDYLPLGMACLCFSFSSVQIAGLMHDSGHRAAFKGRRANDLLGYACCALIGTVFQSWRLNHNAHHGHPNERGKDPDMEIPFVSTSEALWERKRGLERRLAPWQAYYYYPLGMFVGITNRLGAVSYFWKRRFRHTTGALLLYLPAVGVVFIAPFLLFPVEKAVFVFLLVHLTNGVYLANCFAPNHKGMYAPSIEERLSFFEQQTITARNVKGGWLTDIVLVGLNLQIEHHLFPSCPRNRLRQISPYVRRACEEARIPYVEMGAIETHKFLWRCLKTVSRGNSQTGVAPVTAYGSTGSTGK